jgi:hypothetical protein
MSAICVEFFRPLRQNLNAQKTDASTGQCPRDPAQVAEREVQQLTGNWPNGSPSLQTKSLSILVDGCGGKKTLQRHEVRFEDRIANGRVFVDMTSN